MSSIDVEIPPVIDPGDDGFTGDDGGDGSGIGSTLPSGVFSRSSDPAKFLVQARRFSRPRLSIPAGPSFVWPGGMEGVRLSGTNKLAVHTYLGLHNAQVQVLHRDEARIEMSGMFLGETGAENVRALRNVLTAIYPDEGAILILPGIFTDEQRVFCESYDFDKPEEERNDSFTYQVTFVRVGVGAETAPIVEIDSPTTPSSTGVTNSGSNSTSGQGVVAPPSAAPNSSVAVGQTFAETRGTSFSLAIVSDGFRTLRRIAYVTYGNSDKWGRIYSANKTDLDRLKIALHALPTALLPLGMVLVLP